MAYLDTILLYSVPCKVLLIVLFLIVFVCIVNFPHFFQIRDDLAAAGVREDAAGDRAGWSEVIKRLFSL